MVIKTPNFHHFMQQKFIVALLGLLWIKKGIPPFVGVLSLSQPALVQELQWREGRVMDVLFEVPT